MHWLLKQFIILLNPITPFVTETLWGEILDRKELFNEKLKVLDVNENSKIEIDIKINKLKECISQIRSYKKALDIKENCNITEIGKGDFISQNKVFIEKLAKVSLTSNSNYKNKDSSKRLYNWNNSRYRF